MYLEPLIICQVDLIHAFLLLVDYRCIGRTFYVTYSLSRSDSRWHKRLSVAMSYNCCQSEKRLLSLVDVTNIAQCPVPTLGGINISQLPCPTIITSLNNGYYRLWTLQTVLSVPFRLSVA
ncbi:hypothetical protein J6590_036200 [Homalodisca vitripennis]|nr:hypothetical protein J6590_036200 [Homalodisca vitripennis]